MATTLFTSSHAPSAEELRIDAAERRVARRPLAVLGAVAAAGLAWIVVSGIGGVELTVSAASGGTHAVTIVEILAAAAVAGVIGVRTYSAIEAHLARPLRTWLVLCGAATAGSALLPVQAAVGTAATVSLVSLHVIVAVALTAGLVATSAPSSGWTTSEPSPSSDAA